MSHDRPHSQESRQKISAARRGKPSPWKLRMAYIIDGIMMFACCHCRNLLERDAFYPDRRTYHGIASECRECKRVRQLKK